MEQGLRDPNALFHPARKSLDLVVAAVPQTHALDDVVNQLLTSLGLVNTIRQGMIVQIFQWCHVFVQSKILRQIANRPMERLPMLG